MLKVSLPVLNLPCHPCPHGAPCCSRGTELTEAEAHALMGALGHHIVVDLHPIQYRARFKYSNLDDALDQTRTLYATALVPAGRDKTQCILWDNGCAIYGTELYPVMCRAYPGHDGIDPTVSPATDANLCPELGLP